MIAIEQPTGKGGNVNSVTLATIIVLRVGTTFFWTFETEPLDYRPVQVRAKGSDQYMKGDPRSGYYF